MYFETWERWNDEKERCVDNPRGWNKQDIKDLQLRNICNINQKNIINIAMLPHPKRNVVKIYYCGEQMHLIQFSIYVAQSWRHHLSQLYCRKTELSNTISSISIVQIKASATIEAWKCNFPGSLGSMTDKPTIQSTDGNEGSYTSS